MFKELDYRRTPLGELVLRRRSSLALPGTTVYEVTLDGEFLMSSEVTQSEEALTALGLAALPPVRPLPQGGAHNARGHQRGGGRDADADVGSDARNDRDLDVMVGGLGLGHTAVAALDHPRVRSVVVVEYLEPVLEWHRSGLVPLGTRLKTDPRAALVHGDFFAAMAAESTGADRFDAILVDIDHSPEALLGPAHARFYANDGVAGVCRHLRPGGVFALWSADPPPETFLALLRPAFRVVTQHTVDFYNPFLGEQDENTIIVAQDPLQEA